MGVPGGSAGKTPPSMQQTVVRFLGREDPLEKGQAAHSGVLGLNLWLSGSRILCNAGDPSSIPGLGRSPGEGIGYPLRYSGLENSQTVWGHKELDTSERLSLQLHPRRLHHEVLLAAPSCCGAVPSRGLRAPSLPRGQEPRAGDSCLRAYSWDLVAVSGIFLTDVVYLFHQKLLFDSVQ